MEEEDASFLVQGNRGKSRRVRERERERERENTCRKQSEEESKGPVKRPDAAMTLRSRTKSPMATPGRGEGEEGGVKTP